MGPASVGDKMDPGMAVIGWRMNRQFSGDWIHTASEVSKLIVSSRQPITAITPSADTTKRGPLITLLN
jgi:hypothetical protein